MNNKTKILKYLIMFISIYLTGKYIAKNDIIIIAMTSSIMLCILDLYAPTLKIN